MTDLVPQGRLRPALYRLPSRLCIIGVILRGNEGADTMDVFEVINTTRAMRRLKPDPVPDELVWKVLDAAIRAPSGGNRQPWNFIVVRDAAAKKKIAEWYLEAWNASYGPMKDAMASNPDSSRMFNSADHLANHLAEVPVLILAAIRGGDTGTSPAGSTSTRRSRT